MQNAPGEGRLADSAVSSKIPLWFETSPFRGKRVVDKTAEPMKSFSVTSPFREGQSARPLSVGCGVSRRTGRLWIETWLTPGENSLTRPGSYCGPTRPCRVPPLTHLQNRSAALRMKRLQALSSYALAPEAERFNDLIRRAMPRKASEGGSAATAPPSDRSPRPGSH